jgi:hypothetical protein
MKHIEPSILKSRFMSTMTTIVFILLFFVVGEAGASTYYVSTNGNDVNAGTSTAAPH